MTRFETDLLAELLERRHECLTQLHDLGGRQLELIMAEEMSQLLGVLAAKQRLLGKLTACQRQLDPFRGQEPGERVWRSPEKREQCVTLAGVSDDLFARILDQEKRGEDCLRRRRDLAAERLRDVHAAGRATGAYAQAGWSQSIGLDLTTPS